MRLWPAILLTITASSLAAQDPQAAAIERKPSVGFGVTISPIAIFLEDDIGLLPLGLGNILIPIRLNPKMTLEPELGYFKTEQTDPGGGGAPGSSSTFSNSRFGVGVLGDIGAGGPLRPYLGFRVVRVRSTSEFTGGTGTVTATRTGWTMSAVLGGQHFFTETFSLGGEVQMGRTSIGAAEVSGGGSSGDGKISFVGTNGIVAIRWFP